MRPVIDPFVFNQNLREGHRTSVMCTVSSGDLPYRMDWLKDDQPITQMKDILVNRASNYSLGLIFERLKSLHQGNYTCVAENDAGRAQYSSALQVNGM